MLAIDMKLGLSLAMSMFWTTDSSGTPILSVFALGIVLLSVVTFTMTLMWAPCDLLVVEGRILVFRSFERLPLGYIIALFSWIPPMALP